MGGDLDLAVAVRKELMLAVRQARALWRDFMGSGGPLRNVDVAMSRPHDIVVHERRLASLARGRLRKRVERMEQALAVFAIGIDAR